MPELENFPTLQAALDISRVENRTMTVSVDGEKVTVNPDGAIQDSRQTLVPIAAPAVSLPEFRTGNGAIRHNFDGDKMSQWRLSSMATNGQSMNFDDLDDGKFTIKYWYVHTAQVTRQETGELIDVPRVVLMSGDHRSVAFMSVGVMESLMQLVEFMGGGPYDPALTVQFRKIKTPAGFTYTFEPAMEGSRKRR